MTTPTPYTTNLCWNPNVAVDLAGYVALPGTEIAQTYQDAASGSTSLAVQTAGNLSNEGFYGPQAEFLTDGPGSLSVALAGPTGTVQVSAVINPGGVVLASQMVDLTDAWQRVYINDLSIQAGTSLYVLVQTLTPQVLWFMAGAVQYEPESPGHPYIDGSLTGCYWLGEPDFSESYPARSVRCQPGRRRPDAGRHHGHHVWPDHPAHR